jgi:hypothetical protein
MANKITKMILVHDLHGLVTLGGMMCGLESSTSLSDCFGKVWWGLNGAARVEPKVEEF